MTDTPNPPSPSFFFFFFFFFFTFFQPNTALSSWGELLCFPCLRVDVLSREIRAYSKLPNTKNKFFLNSVHTLFVLKTPSSKINFRYFQLFYSVMNYNTNFRIIYKFSITYIVKFLYLKNLIIITNYLLKHYFFWSILPVSHVIMQK